jgi:hypothetical protein
MGAAACRSCAAHGGRRVAAARGCAMLQKKRAMLQMAHEKCAILQKKKKKNN